MVAILSRPQRVNVMCSFTSWHQLLLMCHSEHWFVCNDSHLASYNSTAVLLNWKNVYAHKGRGKVLPLCDWQKYVHWVWNIVTSDLHIQTLDINSQNQIKSIIIDGYFRMVWVNGSDKRELVWKGLFTIWSVLIAYITLYIILDQHIISHYWILFLW